MIHNDLKDYYLMMLLRLIIVFFVFEYLQFFTVCYFRFKLEWTPRIFTLNKLILVSQFLTILFLVGLIGAYLQLYDAISNEPAQAIKFATKHLCSDGVLAHAMQLYDFQIESNLYLIRLGITQLVFLGIINIVIIFFCTTLYTRMRRTRCCLWLNDFLEPKGAEKRKHWLKTTWGGDNEFDAEGYRRDIDPEEINKDPET